MPAQSAPAKKTLTAEELAAMPDAALYELSE